MSQSKNIIDISTPREEEVVPEEKPTPKKHPWRHLFWGIFIVIILIIVGSMASWFLVESIGGQTMYTQKQLIPKKSVGLLLGTSSQLSNGRSNLFFLYRIQAVKELFEANKIDTIIVSGDNRHMNYNEPEQMQTALIEEGIPKDKIVLDYAGIRTLDSVIRTKKIFGQQEITIISQPFHLKRALFLARYSDIDAIGYAARDVSFQRAPRVYVREIGARLRAVYDTLFDTQPRMLGAPILIEP